MRKPKPFATKLTLEGAYFDNLGDLIAQAMVFYRHAPKTTWGKSTDEECLAEARLIAADFCAEQDKRSIE